MRPTSFSSGFFFAPSSCRPSFCLSATDLPRRRERIGRQFVPAIRGVLQQAGDHLCVLAHGEAGIAVAQTFGHDFDGHASLQQLAAVREVRSMLEHPGKASGELDDRPQLAVNVLASSEWLAVRDAVFVALMAHPGARAALSGRLLELEAGS